MGTDGNAAAADGTARNIARWCLWGGVVILVLGVVVSGMHQMVPEFFMLVLGGWLVIIGLLLALIGGALRILMRRR